MMQDLRYSLRRMLQARTWTAVVVLSLALGVGACTVLFSLVEAVLLRDVQLPDAHRLVYLNWVSGPNGLHRYLSGNSDTDQATGRTQSTSFSTLTFQRVRAQTHTLARVFAFAPMHEANLSARNYAEIASGQFVSGNYFAALGVSGMRGRAIAEDDDRAAAPPVVVISDALWQRRFARDPAAIGQTLTLNSLPFTIIGVTPARFTGVHGFSFTPDFSIPLAFESRLFPDDDHAQPWSWWLRIMGRSNAGVSREQVRAELERVIQLAALDGWNAAPGRETSGAARDLPTLQVLDGSGGLADQVRNVAQLIASFAGIAVILLLIVCVNVASMVLARATTRQRELGVRLAIGASRPRLVRLLLSETLVICAAAGGLALLFAAWSIDALAAFLAGIVGVTVDLRLDLRAFAFTLLIALLAGAVSGIAPALRAARLDVASNVKQGAAHLLGKQPPLARVLLSCQLALSLALLVAAGLLVRSVHQMHNIDVGFDTRNLLLFEVSPEAVGYDDTRTVALYEELIRRIEALPGVRAATTLEYPLVSSSGSGNSMHLPGSPESDGVTVRRLKVRSNFLSTMGVPIVQGRDLRPHDGIGAPRVALVNETLARRVFPGQSPVGRRFALNTARRGSEIEIVGVVRDAHIDEVRTANEPAVYLPYPQSVHGSATFEVRTVGSPLALVPAIREELRQAAPDLPVTRFRTQQQQVQSSFTAERMLSGAATFFGAITLLLACIGLYGLLAYNVARRTGEIALRMALGARQDGVVWLVLREVALPLVIGVMFGLAGALALTGTIRDMLYGLTPTDPLTIAAAVLILALTAVVAAFLPARRAARVQPWRALRYE